MDQLSIYSLNSHSGKVLGDAATPAILVIMLVITREVKNLEVLLVALTLPCCLVTFCLVNLISIIQKIQRGTVILHLQGILAFLRRF